MPDDNRMDDLAELLTEHDQRTRDRRTVRAADATATALAADAVEEPFATERELAQRRENEAERERLRRLGVAFQ